MTAFCWLLPIRLMAQEGEVLDGAERQQIQRWNLRHWMILPIFDNVEGSLARKIYPQMENFFSNYDGCTLASNSEVLNILDSYRKNLRVYLDNREVLKVLADRLSVGSLVKVIIDVQGEGVELKVDVIGRNGEELLLRKNARLPSEDVQLIFATIKGWLVDYEQTIPYSGQVVGILGKQITIDEGQRVGFRIGAPVEIYKVKNVRRHPLVKMVVDWDLERIAQGSVASVNDRNSVVVVDGGEQLITDGAFAVVNKFQESGSISEKFMEKNDQEGFEFGKLGELRVNFLAGQGSISNVNSDDGVGKRSQGTLYGAGGLIELWLTRNYWGAFGFSKSFGDLSAKSGELQQSEVSIGQSRYHGLVGYKYLPLGFFYGPQINVFTGYAQQSYEVDYSVQDGYGEFTFSGPVVGGSVNSPLIDQVRLYFSTDFLVRASVQEDTQSYGMKKSAYCYEFEGGAMYDYSKLTRLFGGLEMASAQAKFSNNKKVKFKSTALKFGLSFIF